MTSAGPAARARTAPPSFAVAAVVVLVASLVAGGLTSLGQTYLPDALGPFANSVSGWTIVTALLVWVVRRPAGQSALLGAASFVLLTLGYAVVSDLRGFFFSPLFWSLVGLVAGPMVGASVAASRRSDRWGAVGGGLLAGVVIGDSVNGLTVLAADTGWVYWTSTGVLGVALLVYLAVARLRTVALAALAGAVAVVVGLLLNGFFALASAGLIQVF